MNFKENSTKINDDWVDFRFFQLNHYNNNHPER